jgi:hypothetical protein
MSFAHDVGKVLQAIAVLAGATDDIWPPTGGSLIAIGGS